MRKNAINLTIVLLFCGILLRTPAWGHASKGWKKALGDRTVQVWIDAQRLDDIVLNARAELNVTWLPQSLRKRLDRDRDVHDWVERGLSFYYSTNEETRRRMKGRDILALNYRAVKNWTFDPTRLTVGGYAVTSEDLLGHRDLRITGDLAPGTAGTLYLCVPALKPKSKVEIVLEGDGAMFEVPSR